MPSHLAAFFQSTFGLSLAEIPVVRDDILTQLTPNRFAVPSDYHNILWAAASATNLQRAQVRTPTLQVRRISGEIAPRRQSSPLFNLANLESFRPFRPIALTPTEDFEILETDNAGANQSHYGLVCLGPDSLRLANFFDDSKFDPGDIRTVRLTGTTTLVQGSWVTVVMTPDNTLEPGQYTLLGFLPISANCIASRVLITGQTYRPGVLGLAGTEAVATDFDHSGSDKLMWYNMGSFNHLNIPTWQFLADAADTTEVVYAFVVRTGSALGLTTTPAGP